MLLSPFLSLDSLEEYDGDDDVSDTGKDGVALEVARERLVGVDTLLGSLSESNRSVSRRTLARAACGR